MKTKNPPKAEHILKMISINGGNRSGIAIAAVDWAGNVYIDQFTKDIPIGNIRAKNFGAIWHGEGDLFLQKLRNRKHYLNGRCVTCKWFNQCNGNFRARALSTGDFWASDPACYFTDEEIRA
jgi:radical SAM protein with 4Fe4S-binding SPASM domain